MSSNDILALRKQGRIAEALDMARKEAAANPNNLNDVWFARAYGWALYSHANKLITLHKENKLSEMAVANQISPYMREFSQIANPLRKDMVFSQFLRIANEVSKYWSDFIYFAQWAGLDSFTEEDKKPYIAENGTKIDSLEKRFTRAICREIANLSIENQIKPELLQWGNQVLKKALQDEPDNQWLNYYQSKILLAQGDYHNAIKSLLPTIRRQMNAAWIWALLAHVLDHIEPDDALICYIYSTQLAREDQEVAKVRITLAEKLANVQRYEEASFEVSKALQYRESNNFKIPVQLNELKNQPWYKENLTKNTLRPCASVKLEAKELIAELDKDNLTFEKGYIDHVNKERELSYIVTGLDTGLGIYHKKFPDIKKVPVGTVVEVGFLKVGKKRPISWKVSNEQKINNLCDNFSGVLNKIAGKNFAFITSGETNIFVPPDLASSFNEVHDVPVKCFAIRKANREGKIGWRAVKLSQNNG